MPKIISRETVKNAVSDEFSLSGDEMQIDLVQKSDVEILKVADPIMDNLMDASTVIDHARHIRDFTERAKSVVTPEYLERVCKKYQNEKGFFAKREFVAIFRRSHSLVVIWKQWFTKAPGEHVAEMVLVQDGDRYLVDHVLVF